ncbi:hypothetical protein [Levilactobacillus zymae]|nr:hypothetical protein [Levilactobacillus zymae]
MTSFIIAIILIYFIHDQFEFSKITRISFWIIPLSTLYQFFNTFVFNRTNLLIVGGLILFSIAIGYYQASHTKVRLEETSNTFFRDATGQEVPLYKKVITAQGGRHYLYGWLLVLVVQILIEALYLHEPLTPVKIWDVFLEEVMADLFSFSRFIDGAHTSWIIWALASFTSFGYTFWIARLHPLAYRKLFNKDKFPSLQFKCNTLATRPKRP